MTLRNTGFTLAITGIVLIAAIHAAVEITLSTRPRFEQWQAKRAGAGMYPRDWTWPGVPR